MSEQYVQNVSGQGEKWEVAADCNTGWRVRNPAREADWYLLPKSEYVLCEPPVVQWKDVTAECEVTERGWIVHKDRSATAENGYRRRKVFMNHGCVPYGKLGRWALIIEQKVTG